MHATSSFSVERLLRDEYALWFSNYAQWTHAVTVTFQRHANGKSPAKSRTISSTAHFINVLNRKLLGRKKGPQGRKMACAAVWGAGAYEDNPHVHLALQAPLNRSYEEVALAVTHAVKVTKTLGDKFDIQPFTSEGWFNYMFDHGTEGLLVELISPAKH